MKRLLSLDVLRAVAVLLVLGRHATFPDNVVLNAWHTGGAVGVDLFFVLSGFLCSGILFRELAERGTIDCWRFLARRGFKLYPAFWCLILSTIVVRLMAGAPVPLGRTCAELLFVQNYIPGWWEHTWSLGVEEHFYLALPFLILALSRDNFRSLPRITAMTMCAMLLARFIHSSQPFDDRVQLCPTHLRAGSLLLGVLVAYWFQTNPRLVKFCYTFTCPLALAGIVLLAPSFIWPIETTRWMISIGLTLRAIGSACLVGAFVAGGVPENPFTSILGHIGKHSYSIYLWHLVVLKWLVPSLSLPAWATIPVYLVGSVLLGIQLTRLIEIPALRLRDRVLNREKGGPMRAKCA
jgi:peptidoglycan/LPS O-acetylase OafA/YrhL